MKKRILYTDRVLPDQYREELEAAGYIVTVERPDLNEDELIAALKGAHGYVLGGMEKASRRVIESATDLQVIAFFGVGYQTYIDADAATEYGVAVTNTPGANAQSVAEFTLALILDSVKHISDFSRTTKHSGWKKHSTWDLKGKTLGLIGLGKIGSLVAKMASAAFGMNVIYYSPNRKPDAEKETRAEWVDLPTLLKTSDVLSLHATLTPDSRSMIGTRELQQMKPSSILINTSRAELVDGKALGEALSNGVLAGAAFDGYYTEPSPAQDETGLLELPDEKFVLTPHAAYLTDDATLSVAEAAIACVRGILEGTGERNVVNPEYSKQKRKSNSAQDFVERTVAH